MPVKRKLARTKVLSPEVNSKDFLISRTLAGALPGIDDALSNGHNLCYSSANDDHLTAVARGDGDIQRVGSKFKPLTLQLMGHIITVGGSYASQNTPMDRTIRLSIIRNRNPKGSQLVPNQIYSSNGPDDSTLRNKDYTAEYQVLWTRLYKMEPCIGSTWSGTLTHFGQKVQPVDAFIKLPEDMVTTWKDATNQDITNCLENSLHMIASVDVAGVIYTNITPFELSINARLRFLDM